ncbi:hypothetical protein ABBQ38_003261 [Trebouxia sp. C0009 RCD-2024]
MISTLCFRVTLYWSQRKANVRKPVRRNGKTEVLVPHAATDEETPALSEVRRLARRKRSHEPQFDHDHGTRKHVRHRKRLNPTTDVRELYKTLI